MEEIQRRKEELSVLDREWHSMWMLKVAWRRRGRNEVKYHSLKDMLKPEGDKIKDFLQ